MPPVKFNSARYPELRRVIAFDDDGKPSLPDRVYDQILLQIIHGELAGGAELRSTVLAKQLEVSRTPVNTALARLVSDGIVQQPVNLRATVRPGAENWLVDNHRMRQLVEPEATRAAAGRIPPEVLDDLTLLMRDARPARDGDWAAAARYFDNALHLVIAEYCDNLCLRETMRRCWSFKRLSYAAAAVTDRSLRDGYRQHCQILEQLEAGKAAAAARLMTEHLRDAARLSPGQRVI